MSIHEIIERLERFQGKDEYAGPERRKFVRLAYPPARAIA